MATEASTIQDLLARLTKAGDVTARKMFGEYCLYLDDIPVALVCDDCLYVKTTPAGKSLLGDDVAEAPPYPAAKPHLMLPMDSWSDGERLSELLRVTKAQLPRRKPRKRRR
jgi:TfoX/Sxy family transcriptional regulator of competence genes